MISASPHQYRADGRALGRPEPVLDAALAQAGRAEASGAPAILTLMHLAKRMDVSHTFLRSVVGSKEGTHYREFHISKRDGGGRRIAVPSPELMAVQRWIVREILRDRPVHPASFAYARGSSIYACARQHAGAGWLLKLDIHDFFESISEKSIYRVFREIGYGRLVAFELARLCTRPWVAPPRGTRAARSVANASRRGIEFYRRDLTGYLPQGAPTSPMLSNLVFRVLDERLSQLAARNGLIYTRYSDDLTFSGPASGFSRANAAAFIGQVRELLATRRFRLHERKINIVPPGGRKVVLGLLVDRSVPRLSRELRNRLEDHVRSAIPPAMVVRIGPPISTFSS
ncbi:reverse transcriptase family protein [Flavisphingomonas formosensis]|uniref:reverse transcriptase family protein n=1 Tax=Flavisphingomonas formosensis TaxID=861534 RepID=UPI0012F975EE|nr:reverse transcriptase family protein [Sphingomonas formosensis]